MSTTKTTKTTKVEPKAADKVETVKKADVQAAPAKAAAVKAEPKAAAVKAEPKAAPVKAEAKAAPAAEKKTPGRKPAVKAAVEKAVEKKTPGRKPAGKKAAAAKTEKKAPVKRAAKATEEVFIEYAGTQVSTADIVARVVEATGKKASAIKALNVYVQPETGKIYYTADGESGEIAY